jgi:hypothetical protein
LDYLYLSCQVKFIWYTQLQRLHQLHLIYSTLSRLKFQGYSYLENIISISRLFFFSLDQKGLIELLFVRQLRFVDVENSTKEHKSSSNPLGSSPSYRFAVLFIFLALFKGTQKDIPSVRVYYYNKVFQTSNIESEIKSKRKHLSCSLPLLYTAFQSVCEWEREMPRGSLNILFFYVSLNGANHFFQNFEKHAIKKNFVQSQSHIVCRSIYFWLYTLLFSNTLAFNVLRCLFT